MDPIAPSAVDLAVLATDDRLVINGFSVRLVRRRHLNGPFLFLGQPEAAQVGRFGEDQLAAWRNVPSMRALVS